MHKTELPPYDAFYKKLRSCIPLQTKYTDYVNLLKTGFTTEQTVDKLKISKPPSTGIEKYHYLQQIWKQEKINSFMDFLWWYNNKDLVPILATMQKMIASYPDKEINMLKFGCTLANPCTFVYKNQSMKISIPSQREIKTYCKKFKKISWWSIYHFCTQSSC